MSTVSGIHPFLSVFFDLSDQTATLWRSPNPGRISPIALCRYIAKQFGRLALSKYAYKLCFT
jgi:hypothetical protein